MKITMESTTQLVEIATGGGGSRAAGIPARVWVGTTEQGIPVQVLVTRIAVSVDEQQEAFARELAEQVVRHAAPPEPAAFPARLVL